MLVHNGAWQALLCSLPTLLQWQAARATKPSCLGPGEPLMLRHQSVSMSALIMASRDFGQNGRL